MAELRTSVILDLVDRISRPVQRIRRRFGQFANSPQVRQLAQNMGQVTQSLGRTTDAAMRLGSRLALITGGAGFAFKRLFIDTAAEFERFRTVLETVEGTSAGAQRAMDWVSRFATTTPYELDQVTEAYVRLRAYGLDPTNGLLKTLGDTSAAMDKPLMQSVEAIADAVNGEYERLKEFGIKAFTQGTRTAFVYTNQAGEQISKVVNNRNREMIESTLAAIWSDKYAGAMGKLSRTWGGMMSNLSDQWTRFANMTMASGVFDWLKDRLAALLERINTLAETGQLQQLAETFGRNLVEGLKEFYRAMQATWDVLQAVGAGLVWLRDLFGSWKPVIAAVAAVMAGPLLLAIGGLLKNLFILGRFIYGGALKYIPMLVGWLSTLAMGFMSLAHKAVPAIIAGIRTLSLALLTTPVGWIITAIAAIAGGAYLLYRNWDQVGPFFARMWESIKAWFDQGIGTVMKDLLSWSPAGLIMKAIDNVFEVFTGRSLADAGAEWIGGLWNGIDQTLTELTSWLAGKLDTITQWLPDWAKDGLGIDSVGRTPTLGAPALPDNQPLPMAQAGQTEVGGLLRLEIDSQGRPTVRELRNNGPMDLEVDLGVGVAY